MSARRDKLDNLSHKGITLRTACSATRLHFTLIAANTFESNKISVLANADAV